MADAGLVPGADGAAAPERIGIYLGSALGGIAFAESQHEQYLARGLRGVSPTLALAVFGGAAPANLGIALDVRGPILSTANSCASGAVAIGEALNAIRDGEIDAAIAGGVECPLSPLAFGAFDLIRALGHGFNDDPPHAARPMDARRDGFVMGEGAALLVLESEDSGPGPRRATLRRGAGLRRHLGRPPHGPAAAGRPRGGPRGRRSRSRTPARRADEIDWVSAHASSTPIGDIAEARALAAALGDRAATVPVSATKAMTGHPLGATGAIEAAMAALAIRDGFVPGSANLEAPEPELDDAPAGAPPRGLRGPVRARALDLVRVRRAERRAGAGRAGVVGRGRAGPRYPPRHVRRTRLGAPLPRPPPVLPDLGRRGSRPPRRGLHRERVVPAPRVGPANRHGPPGHARPGRRARGPPHPRRQRRHLVPRRDRRRDRARS